MRLTSLTLVLAVSLATVACGPRDSDKLDDNELATAAGRESAQDASRCTTRVAQDEIKRQLFARAAEIRGANATDFAKIDDFAVLQLDNPSRADTAATGALTDCRAVASLRLPAGLRVAGGRTTLRGDISYSLGTGGETLTLGESDAIAIPLATLTQRRAAGPPTPAPVAIARDSDRLATPAPPPVERSEPAPPAPTYAARPSFDCRRARTSGELAVCGDPELADLDRAMAEQYRTAVANAGPAERRLLTQTRDRFLGFRDRCDSDNCIARTYRGRMREIDDIAAGRWQPPR